MAGIFRIEQFEFEKLCSYIRMTRFSGDGCLCGELVFKLSAGFYIIIWRHCHKSNSTPDKEMWHINDEPEFCVNIPKDNNIYIIGERSGDIDIRLVKDQWTVLRNLAIEKSEEDYEMYWRHW